MNMQDEPISEIMKRFKWIDDYTIRLVNKEGIEKIIDLNSNCSEVSYNVVPLFKNKDFLLQGQNFY